eukprot:gene5430-8895_t
MFARWELRMDVHTVRQVFEELAPSEDAQAAIAFYHATILAQGWNECIEERDGWKTPISTFHYTKHDKRSMLKAIVEDNNIHFHFQIVGEDIVTIACDISSVVNQGSDSKNPDVCLTLGAADACRAFVKSAFPKPQNIDTRSEDTLDPLSNCRIGGDLFRQSQIPSSIYNIGRSDLDPGLGMYGRPPIPGSGMYMGPNHPLFNAGPRRPDPERSGFPPGSVPPGARFDPVTPFGVGNNRRGPAAFGEPNPDHLRRPGGWDPFM